MGIVNRPRPALISDHRLSASDTVDTKTWRPLIGPVLCHRCDVTSDTRWGYTIQPPMVQAGRFQTVKWLLVSHIIRTPIELLTNTLFSEASGVHLSTFFF